MTSIEKEKLLVSLIHDLCKKEYSQKTSNQKNSFNKLKQIYCDNYRHSYSKIFNELQNIFSDDLDISTTLGENLKCLDDYLQKQRVNGTDATLFNDVISGFRKLSDHINLEIGRYNFIKQQFAGEKTAHCEGCQGSSTNINSEFAVLSERVEKQQEVLNNIQPSIIKAVSETDKIDSKLEANKLSSITALTIFSAVIMAFSGGISFESSVFESISSTSIYRLAFIVALSGFILFNTVFALLYIVGKMCKKPIGARCKYMANEDGFNSYCRACGDGYCAKQCSSVSILCKIWRKYSYVFAVNLILLLFMYYDAVIWLQLPRKIFVSYCARQYLPIIAPAIAAALIWIIIIVRHSVQRGRIRLSIKCEVVSNYYAPCAPILESIKATLAAFNSSEIFREPKEDIEQIIESDLDAKTKLSKIDCFIEENYMTTERLAQTITYRIHLKNKRAWKELENKISEKSQKKNKKSAK